MNDLNKISHDIISAAIEGSYGLLIDFNVDLLKEGIKRIVNNFPE